MASKHNDKQTQTAKTSKHNLDKHVTGCRIIQHFIKQSIDSIKHETQTFNQTGKSSNEDRDRGKQTFHQARQNISISKVILIGRRPAASVDKIRQELET